MSLAAIVTLGGGFGSSVVDNVVNGNTGAGVYASAGSTVTGNTVRGNSYLGPWMDAGVGYGGNVVSANNGGAAQVLGGVQIASNLCDGVLCP